MLLNYCRESVMGREGPLNVPTGIWTKTNGIVEVTKNVLDIMIAVIVLSAWGWGIRTLQNLFHGLNRM